jgi:hypothetical protein
MSVSMTGSGEVATPVESSKSAMTWGPIFGGAAAAIGVTLILLLLGSGLGLTMVSLVGAKQFARNTWRYGGNLARSRAMAILCAWRLCYRPLADEMGGRPHR